jgi:hypothetical protein
MKIRSAIILVMAIFLSVSAHGQQMKKSVVASGGGHSESSLRLLDCTIGQVFMGTAASGSSQLRAGFWTGGASSPLCAYLPGDINSDGQTRASDVTFGVRYFKGLGASPLDSCRNDSVVSPNHYLFVAGDVNGDCQFKGSDVTRLVQYFKGFASLIHCRFFPPPPIALTSQDEAIPLMMGNTIQQPVLSPSAIPIRQGIIGSSGTEIKNPPAPINSGTKGVKTSSLQKK